MVYAMIEGMVTHIQHTINEQLEIEPDLANQAHTVMNANKYRLIEIGRYLKSLVKEN